MSPMPSDSVSAILIDFQPTTFPDPSVGLLKRTLRYLSQPDKKLCNTGWLTGRNTKQKHICLHTVPYDLLHKSYRESSKTCSVFILGVDCKTARSDFILRCRSKPGFDSP
jgi:hypothetical protein